MARGWESKSVADQIEERGELARERAIRYEVSPAVRARRERLESLRLARARTLVQIESPLRAAHREMLRRTLEALDKEIADLS